jgi:hypothetical protein
MRRLDHLQSVKFLRLDISFSQGDEWKALISKYIDAPRDHSCYPFRSPLVWNQLGTHTIARIWVITFCTQ